MLQKSSGKLKGKIVDNHVVLDITGDAVHYWSPQLSFRIEPDFSHEHSSVISGIIGPRPGVWTLFSFIYFFLGTVGFFVGSYGASNVMLGKESLLIWAFPVAILFMLSAFLTSKYGERLAKDQTEILKDFVREAVQVEGANRLENHHK
ncbi:MAG: hypothetical protein NWQ46_01715 [Spirosomaceae bacterium]|nr:hypothetical protein [Spirosomataceae bacterium]